jgi:hypothetical protein
MAMHVRLRFPVIMLALLACCISQAHAQDALPQPPQVDPYATPEARAACGPKFAKFDVRLDKRPFTASQPPSGMARVYIVTQIEPLLFFMPAPPITRLGLDGQWIGAARTYSYIALDVSPGIHHLCAALPANGSAFARASRSLALARLDAQPGHTYSFWALSIGFGDSFTLQPINRDEAAMFLETIPESISRMKGKLSVAKQRGTPITARKEQ